MKKSMMRLLVAAMMLGMTSYASANYGGVIRVTCENNGTGNNNTSSEYPHWAPAHYSNLATAYWDAEPGELSISFYAESDEVTISIYQDDTLVEETTRSVSVGSVASFNLSSYGSGDYQIVITGLSDDDLYGNFSY